MNELEIICQPPEKHAFASPSKLAIIEACPYMAKNCQGWEETTSVYAERGRRMHAAMYDEKARAELDEPDRDLIMKMREIYVEPYLEAGMTVYHEVFVEIKDEETGEIITFGTIDLVIVSKDQKHLMLIDLKFGSTPVESAEQNRQLRAYFVGAMQKFKEAVDAHVCIAQPKLGTDDEDLPLFTREKDYKNLYYEVKSTVMLARRAEPEDANPGEDACRWCNKKACPAYRKAMLRACEEFHLAVLNEEELQEVPPAELVDFCDDRRQMVEVAEDVIKNWKTVTAEVILKAGGSAHYRVQQAGSRRVVDWKAVALECNIPQDVIERHTTLSLSAPFVKRRQRKV